MSLVTALTLTGCATAQMHTDEQLNTVSTGCGLLDGEVMQDVSEKRLLFLMREQPSPEQRACVYHWAHRNHLNLVVIHLANGSAS